MVVESDGSILVAGSMSGHFALLHYASDGTQDTSFGGATDGIVTVDFGGTDETPSAMALGQSGSIFVAGTSTQTSTGKDFALAQFNADGTLYTFFGTGGLITHRLRRRATTRPAAMAIQPADGKILARRATTIKEGGLY